MDQRLHRRALAQHQLGPVGRRNLGRPRRFPALWQLSWPLAIQGERVHGREGGQRRHVGRRLHRRARADKCPDVDGHDPGHQDDPGQAEPDKGRPAVLHHRQAIQGARRSAPGPRRLRRTAGRSAHSPSGLRRPGGWSAPDPRGLRRAGGGSSRWPAGTGAGPGSRAATAVALIATGRTPKGRPTGSSTDARTRVAPSGTTVIRAARPGGSAASSGRAAPAIISPVVAAI